jgi:Domain of unknown function DUF29
MTGWLAPSRGHGSADGRRRKRRRVSCVATDRIARAAPPSTEPIRHHAAGAIHAGPPYDPAMPNDLYDRDVLAWSEHQADLLRRLARGERVNDVDWEHVVEEIEDVGLSELHAVQSYLNHMLVHLLKLCRWPDSLSANHWRVELVAFQKDAARRFAPSMRQRIDLGRLYADALEQLEPLQDDSIALRTWPADCPFTLDQLLHDKRAALEEQLCAASPGSTD